VPWRSALLDLAWRLRGVCSRCFLPRRASARGHADARCARRRLARCARFGAVGVSIGADRRARGLRPRKAGSLRSHH